VEKVVMLAHLIMEHQEDQVEVVQMVELLQQVDQEIVHQQVLLKEIMEELQLNPQEEVVMEIQEEREVDQVV
jgi:hypothetical protein